MIINLAFCGDWGETVWTTGDAGKGKLDGTGTACFDMAGTSCDEFVRSNPGAFSEAYWKIASINIYKIS